MGLCQEQSLSLVHYKWHQTESLQNQEASSVDRWGDAVFGAVFAAAFPEAKYSKNVVSQRVSAEQMVRNNDVLWM